MENINKIVRHKKGEYMQAVKLWKSSEGKYYYTGYLSMTTRKVSWPVEYCQIVE